MNYYRRFPGDYARDTVHLTMTQDGAYGRLLDYMYSTEKAIPTLELAFKICRANDRKDRNSVRFVLKNFFYESDEGYRHKRVDEEISLAESKRSSAKRSANARWTQCERNANASKTQCSPDSRRHTPEKEKLNTCAWPENFPFLPAMQEYALAKGIENPRAEFDAWHDDCLANGRKYSDWMAAWRARCNNYEKFSGGKSGTRQAVTGGISRAEKRVQEADRQAERVFGRPSGLVGALRPDLSRRSDRALGDGVPRDANRLAIGDSAPIVPASAARVTRISSATGPNIRNSTELNREELTERKPSEVA